MKPLLALAFAAALFAALGASDAAGIGQLPGPQGAAAAPPAGITVTGSGAGSADAGLFRLRSTLTAEAKLADEALTNFIDARNRAIGELMQTGVEGLRIRPLGPRVSFVPQLGMEEMFSPNMILFGDEPMTDAEAGVRYSEIILIELAGLNQMDEGQRHEAVASLIDSALDAGLALPSASGDDLQMRFLAQVYGADLGDQEQMELLSVELQDREAAEKAAFAEAMEQASTRAKNLADLAGAQLGPASAIEVVALTTEWNQVTLSNVCHATLRVTFAMN